MSRQDGKSIFVSVKYNKQLYQKVEVRPGDRVLHLKEAVEELTGVPVARQKLLLQRGVSLTDNGVKVVDAGVKAGDTLMLVGSAAAPPQPASRPSPPRSSAADERRSPAPSSPSAPKQAATASMSPEDAALGELRDIRARVEKELAPGVDKFIKMSTAHPVGGSDADAIKKIYVETKHYLEKAEDGVDAILTGGAETVRSARKDTGGLIRNLVRQLEDAHTRWMRGSR